MELKNADSPQAEDLLAPRPTVPNTAVPKEEADRLDAGIMLHQAYRVQRLSRDGPRQAGRFVLAIQGSVSSDRIQVQTPTGPEASQRAMWCPDLVVEVRDGRIHGIRPRLHED
jgi:hypothetical protein